MENSILVNLSLLFGCVFLMSSFSHVTSTDVIDLIFEKNKTCEKIQMKYASAAQQFTYCSITSARPITICEDCINLYLDVLTAHQEILEGQEDGVTCRDQLINVDRLEIIETIFTNLKNLWTRGGCDYCFEVDVNGTTTSNRSNNTRIFQSMNSIVKKCIIDNMPKDKPNICVICRDAYEKLNNFYNNLKNSEVPGSRICMDIVDSMNASRMEWSKDLGCKIRPGVDLPFILSASSFSVIPVVFYIALKACSSRIEHRT